LKIGAFAASQYVVLGMRALRSRYRNDILGSAGKAPEDFIARHAGHWAQRRLRFVLKPAVGALVTVPLAWPKIEKTGSRVLRRFKLRLCFDPALLYAMSSASKAATPSSRLSAMPAASSNRIFSMLMRYAAVSSRLGHPFRGVAPSNLASSSRGQHVARPQIPPRFSALPVTEER